MNRRGFLRTGVMTSLAGLAPRMALASREEPPIRLNANENALGLSPAAQKALLASLGDSNRYPFGSHFRFIEQLARFHGVSPRNVFLGNGSSEILRLAVHRFARQGCTIVAADPTYEAVPWLASNLGLKVERIPLAPDYSHDLEEMRRVSESLSGTVIVYICNPNNPTATLTSSREITHWVETAPQNVHFLVDEAYVHYVQEGNYSSHVGSATGNPNLIVVRTFSKVFAMAGLRIGYAVSHPESIQTLNDLSRLNVNQLAIAAASASLEDREFVQESLQLTEEGKSILKETLNALEIPYLPSHANFLMFRVSGELAEFSQRMASEGFLVGRPFPPLTDHCRLSIGLPDEMRAFSEVLKRFRNQSWI